MTQDQPVGGSDTLVTEKLCVIQQHENCSRDLGTGRRWSVIEATYRASKPR